MELNVLSFNIWCADHLGNNSIASRAPRLKEVLKKIDADIIGLQECTPKWLKHLEEEILPWSGGEYIHCNSYTSIISRSPM